MSVKSVRFSYDLIDCGVGITRAVSGGGGSTATMMYLSGCRYDDFMMAMSRAVNDEEEQSTMERFYTEELKALS